MDLTYFSDRAIFTQEIELLNSNLSQIEVELNYQACDDALCIFRTENFVIALDGTELADYKKINSKSKKLAEELRLEFTQSEF